MYKYNHLLELTHPEKQKQEAINRLSFFRKCRDQKLAACDWTQLADCKLTETQKIEWAKYRQALRDLPSSATSDGYVTWPKKPT